MIHTRAEAEQLRDAYDRRAQEWYSAASDAYREHGKNSPQHLRALDIAGAFMQLSYAAGDLVQAMGQETP